MRKTLVGVACGSGLSAKAAVNGGADFILALNSGIFRNAGLGALAGYMPYANCNEMILNFSMRELLPRIKETDLFVGFHPYQKNYDYLQLKKLKITGVINYPTVGLIDGQYREALEEAGFGYDNDITFIQNASKSGLKTIAFVFNKEQALQMYQAGADILCLHLGLTQGGHIGAKKVIGINDSIKLFKDVFDHLNEDREIIKMIYGGPISTVLDWEYFYNSTNVDGFIGGSTFERIPSEVSIEQTTFDFKDVKNLEKENLTPRDFIRQYRYDYSLLAREYIHENYKKPLTLTKISQELHISRSYLSSLFNDATGMSFSEYLNNYRIQKAIILKKESSLSWTEIAFSVGYKNYANFSYNFKKLLGESPRDLHK